MSEGDINWNNERKCVTCLSLFHCPTSSSGVKGLTSGATRPPDPISHITIPVVSMIQSPGPSSSEQEFSFQTRKMTQEASTWTVPLLAGASLVSSIVTANLFLSTAAERPSKAMSLTIEVSNTLTVPTVRHRG